MRKGDLAETDPGNPLRRQESCPIPSICPPRRGKFRGDTATPSSVRSRLSAVGLSNSAITAAVDFGRAPT
jgi:hypothetical protein